jgi:hypothetical protein
VLEYYYWSATLTNPVAIWGTSTSLTTNILITNAAQTSYCTFTPSFSQAGTAGLANAATWLSPLTTPMTGY